MLRARIVAVVSGHRLAAASLCGAVVALAVGGGVLVGARGGPGDSLAAASSNARAFQPPDLSTLAHVALAPHNHAATLPAATAPPEPAPPSLAGAPPLKPHEVFGFAPYWTLDQSGGFNTSGLSTIAYFSVDLNGDGSLVKSGPGWNGYNSQALVDLVNRAHAAGDRVVLTVTEFSQTQLDQLTSSAPAATLLASELQYLISAKNLDGVNLDFEGSGTRDQAGLTKLVTTVSDALHGANPHYQVTLDTYSSSASGTNGYYNIPALAPVVDAFFVMEYNPNIGATQSTTSPLTSGMFSDTTTANEYAAAVPASKVILGLPYFGIDWPTSDGTLTAAATGGATPLSLGQILSSGHPLYWDALTQSGWTSYQVGTQWHETFFDTPTSFYDAAKLAQDKGLAGVGIWALGMDGNNAQDLGALCGFAPAVKGGPAGPASTPPSGAAPAKSTTTTDGGGGGGSGSSGSDQGGDTSTTTTTDTGSGSGSTTTSTSSTTTTTTRPKTTTTTTSSTTTTTLPPLTYSGVWRTVRVTLSKVTGGNVPPVGLVPQGQMTGFTTNDPSVSCLSAESGLLVWEVSGSTTKFVVEATTGRDCTNADFLFSTS